MVHLVNPVLSRVCAYLGYKPQAAKLLCVILLHLWKASWESWVLGRLILAWKSWSGQFGSLCSCVCWLLEALKNLDGETVPPPLFEHMCTAVGMGNGNSSQDFICNSGALECTLGKCKTNADVVV